MKPPPPPSPLFWEGHKYQFSNYEVGLSWERIQGLTRIIVSLGSEVLHPAFANSKQD